MGAQPPVRQEPRVLILLDGSSSMLQSWQGPQTRFSTASVLIQKLMDSVYAVDPKVEFGLRVYGHQSPYPENNCFDTRREVAFSKNNRTQMELRLAALRPSGVSPIAYSLMQAAEEDLTEENRYSYSVILITDGGESCNGDLCAVARELEKRSVFFKPYIISLVDYAPLAQQYKCLGTYLTVAQKDDMPRAIGQIVEAYRPALQLLAKGEKPISTNTIAPVNTPKQVVVPAVQVPVAEVPKPVVVPVVPVAEIPKPVPPPIVTVRSAEPVVARLRARLEMRLLADTQYIQIGKTIWAIPLLAMPVPEALPAAERTTVAQLAPKIYNWVLPAKPDLIVRSKPVTIPRLAPVVPEASPEVPPLTHVIRRKRVPQSPEPIVLNRLRNIPTLPRLTKEQEVAVVVVPPPPIPKPTPKPTSKPAEIPNTKAAEFTVSSESSTKTGIEVFFTDGKGKFYKSTPQMQVLNAKGGALVKKFYRTVGPDGNPDLQELEPGTYNVVVLSKTSVVARNITVTANEKKKVVITLSNGSLSFSYATAPDRPIKEFEANVVRRFAGDNTIVKQPASEERYYEPGTYYVELNTLPVTRRSLEIDLGGTTEVLIPEPGWVQFTNTEPIEGPVTLYAPLGDGFASFLKTDITGNLSEQKIRLQPGTYEGRWLRAGTPVIVRFLVKSNETTQTGL